MESENIAKTKRTRGKSLDIDLPNTTSDNLKSLILAFYKMNAAKEMVTTNKLSDILNFSRDLASKQMRFLTSVQILKKESRGYTLTQLGEQYAQNLDWNQEDDAKLVLSDLLNNSSTVEKLLMWLETQKTPVTKEETIKRIGIISNVPSHRTDLKIGMDTIIELMIESNIISEMDDKTIMVKKSDPQTIVQEKIYSLTKVDSEFNEYKKVPISVNLNLNINIDDQTDLETLRELVNNIKSFLTNEEKK